MPAVKEAVVAGVRRAPLPLAVPLVRRRIRRAHADPDAMAVARRQMEFVVGAALPDADLDDLAGRYLEQMVWRRELRWHPRAVTRQQVTGIENLTRVRGEHGGLILCFLHHGRFDGLFASLKAAGAPPLTTVVAPILVDPDDAYLKAHRRLIDLGSTAAPSTAGFQGLRDLVLAGHTLTIAVDMPGSTRVRFLGRDLLGASGAARIAHDTGTPLVLVLPTTTDGLSQRITLSEPLLPQDHADPVSLLQAALDRFEPSVLAWPEAYEWPRAKFTQLDEQGNPVVLQRDPGEPTH
jgi:lauroyl/myristoyl acyltransferase